MAAILLLVTVLAAQPQDPAPAPAGPQPAGAGRGAGAGGQGRGGTAAPDFSPRPPVLPLSPEEQAAKFWLPPGFRMEPVLADPAIQEPAQIAFDGNGRMYVIELRTYMQDADGSNTLAPDSRISVHEDRDNDGRYETSRVFVDGLVFPRFVMPLGDGAVLTKESNADEVWKFTDTDRDGVADRKELFATGMGRVANVEHQESGLMWALDNWIYSTVNPVRLRITKNGALLREPTGANGGAWGATQDNHGKLWFQVGATGLPNAFQIPVLYGDLQFAQQFEPEMDITWGAPVRVADMQGGMGSVRMPDGSLMRVTAGAGNDIYRGDRLPADLVGDYFHGEVVARIVRRLRPTRSEGLTRLRNVHAPSEFIRSIDPLFRPVDMTTAPDGTMYITDMYRGIIQESQWSGPGTYLRQRIEQYQLDKVVRRGRVWRLSYDGMARRSDPPRMLDETPAQLVRHLSDANGWWRDTAQQLLVLRGDTSVVPALVGLVRNRAHQLGRIHALWTLEGLGAVDPVLVRALFDDPDSQLRQHALRVSETLYKSGERTLFEDYKRLTKDTDLEVRLQAFLTMNQVRADGATEFVKLAITAERAEVFRRLEDMLFGPPVPLSAMALRGAARELTDDERAVVNQGAGIYKELCFACHGNDGLGTPRSDGTTLAPPVAASARVLGHRDGVIKVLLHGLTGPVNGIAYQDVMVPMGMQSDAWIAAVASYIRNGFGNRESLVTPEQVARVRAAIADRKQMWSAGELDASLPRQIVLDSRSRLTASDNSSIASYAIGMQPWFSRESQHEGMWLAVELPEPRAITELQFIADTIAPGQSATAGAPPRSIPGGRRGGGAAAPLGYPRGYEVQVSLDGAAWTTVATGRGAGLETAVSFVPTPARFVRVRLTETPAEAVAWSVLRLRLYEAGAPQR